MTNENDWVEEYGYLLGEHGEVKISIAAFFHCLTDFKDKVERDCGKTASEEYATIISCFMHLFLKKIDVILDEFSIAKTKH